jgi:hypothetical protein
MSLLKAENKLISEGGHAFPSVNTLVPNELLEINVKLALSAIFDEEDLTKLPFKFIGNTSKPFLGDVDVAVDKAFVAEKLGVDPSDKKLYLELVNLVKSKLPGSEAKAFTGFQQVSFTKDLVDAQGNPVPAINRDTQKPDLNVEAVFQIDLMLGTLGYLGKIMSGSPKGSQYKAVYRNLFLMAIFGSLEQDTGTKDPKTGDKLYSRYDITNKDGMRQMIYRRLPNGKKLVVRDKILSTDPTEIARLLFRGPKTFDDIDSFEELWVLVNGPDFLYPNKKQSIISSFTDSLSGKGMAIPKEISV